MVVQLIIFIAGLVVLYFGAEWLVKAASSIALRFGIRPMVVGLTVVALGTSMPEFVLNFFAVLARVDALAVGNIVGSNIANIGLILGVSSILMPIVVDGSTLRKEVPMMLAVTIVFYLLALDGRIGRLDGAVLVVGLLGFMTFLVFDARAHARASGRTLRQSLAGDHLKPSGDENDEIDNGDSEAQPETETDIHSTRRRILYLLGGMIGLMVGARLMVHSSVNLASMLGIHPVVIGLTIVAIGTSLPELAASIICAVKKEGDMSVGNVIGSNMLNVLFVVGVIALIRPLEVEQVSIDQHFPVMIAFAVVFFILARFRQALSKPEGLLLVAGFAGYLTWLITPYL